MTVKSKTEDYGGLNPSVVKTQMADLVEYNDWLCAQIRALGGTPKKPNDPFDSLSILERVALTLALADETCSAVQSVPIDPAGHHTPHPDDRAIVGSATRRARHQRDKLIRTLMNGCSVWEEAKFNDFRTVRKPAPKTRCRNEGNCYKANRWVDAWDENGRANEFCSGCGHRLPPPNDKT